MNSSPARSRSSSMGMEKETIIMNKEMENKYKIPLSHLRRKYSEAALEQLLRVFQAYDVNFSGYIGKDVFPKLCEDLDVKPWKAMKEIDIENGKISFEHFVNWWFNKNIEHNKHEEKYVMHILDNYEEQKSGFISPGNLVELANDLGIKPWHIFKELEVDPKKGVKKDKIVKWWFQQDISKDNDQGHLMFIEELKPVQAINEKLLKIQGEIAEISVLLQMINPSEPDVRNN